MLIATAGHVNHGKTALIGALTGVDTDRLPEEKRRGLSIDLGFAYAQRPEGRLIGFVDVPGHDQYLRNMIAGILPLDCALLVVAADEGLRQQTYEHLEILDLVGTSHLVAVLTRIDRTGDAQVAQSETQLRNALARTSFANAALFRLSSHTGEGVKALQQHLDGLTLNSGPEDNTGFRLPIDRAFTLSGIGTVVTGTILSGKVRVGDRLMLTPGGIGARVRSLHAQNQPTDTAAAGVRCAVAISGALVEKDKIKRGDMLVSPALHAPTEKVGARLKLAGDARLRSSTNLLLYHGTGRTAVRLRLFETENGGEDQLAELTPAQPIAALYGDRILLRDEVAGANVAGGAVIDPFLPGRGIAQKTRIDMLNAASRHDAADALSAMIDATGFADFKRFCLARNLGTDAVKALQNRFAAQLARADDVCVLLSDQTHDLAQMRLIDGLAEYHSKWPHRLGPRKEEAMLYMGRPLAGAAAQACLANAIAEGCVVADAACIRLAAHHPHLAEEDQQLWDRLGAMLQEAQLRPPHIGALADAFSLSLKEMENCLARFEQFGLLTRVAKNRFFLPGTIERFRSIVTELAQDSDGDGFTAADFNQRSGVGRNLSIEVLEYLDATGVTRRTGPRRHLL